MKKSSILSPLTRLFGLSCLLFLGFLGSSKAQSCIDSSIIDTSFNCPGDTIPVCGCDSNTYINECVAVYHYGIVNYSAGPCQQKDTCINPSQVDTSVHCPNKFSPVCGCDGKTYANYCYAENYAGVTMWTKGPCRNDRTCIDSTVIDTTMNCSWDTIPVCGCDGITYASACVAYFSHGVTKWSVGPCNGPNATGMNESINELELRVFPNPNNGQMNIAFNNSRMQSVQIAITDLSGKQVFVEAIASVPKGQLEYTLQLSNELPNGLYLLEVTTAAEAYRTPVILNR